jgi:hypothetical protein
LPRISVIRFVMTSLLSDYRGGARRDDPLWRSAGMAQIGILALLAIYFLVWPLWRVPFPIEIAPNEGWNAYWADAAGSGGTLYPSPDSLIVNNYPPLSFYALGLAQKIFGDALYIGRTLSILATLGIGALIGRIILQLDGGRAAAAIGGLWFVAVMGRSFNRFVGVNDPQLAGQFLMVAALSWFLARDKAAKSASAPLLLMVIAGFWKHNIVAVPATVMTWLILRDGRRAIRPVVIGVGAAVLGLAICIAIYGDLFLVNLLTPRPQRLMRAVEGLGRLQWILPALVIWSIWAWCERATSAARFTALFVGIAFAGCFMQWTGEDVLDNAQFDLVIATAIGMGLVFDSAGTIVLPNRLGAISARSAIVAILAIRLLATLRIEPFLVLTDPGYRAEYYAHAASARAEAARVAAMPGLIACDLKVICRMAGKPFVYDDFRAEMLIESAKICMNYRDLIREHGLTYFQNEPESDINSLSRTLFGSP